MKRYKRITAIFLCIVFSAMLASLCVFAYLHCPDCCQCESCHICTLIHSTGGILRGSCISVYAAAAMLILSIGCAVLEGVLKERRHDTLVVLKVKLSY